MGRVCGRYTYIYPSTRSYFIRSIHDVESSVTEVECGSRERSPRTYSSDQTKGGGKVEIKEQKKSQ